MRTTARPWVWRSAVGRRGGRDAGLSSGSSGTAEPARPYTTWSDYGGSADSMQYSALAQVDASNVKTLELAWSHPAPGPSGRFAFGPLIVDDVMYVVGKDNAVVALDADTGKQRWSRALPATPTNRGFNYWESNDRSDRRLIFAVDSFLQRDRRADRRVRHVVRRRAAASICAWACRARRNVQSGTPGRVFENLIILGSADRRRLRLASRRPARVRRAHGRAGLDVPHHSSSRRVRLRHLAAGRLEVRGRRQHVGRDLDRREARHRLLPDRLADVRPVRRRSQGANLFGNCLLALDARTGKRLWHYQLVHHDLWDYDLVAAPKLLTIRHDGPGRRHRGAGDARPACSTSSIASRASRSGRSKSGPCRRATSRASRPGPRSRSPRSRRRSRGRSSRRTTSIPYVDAAEQEAAEEDDCSRRATKASFTPPTLTREFIVSPGQLGGANFGAAAADPATGMLYVRAQDTATIHQLRPWDANAIRGEGETPQERGLSVYAQGCQQCHGDVTLPRACRRSIAKRGSPSRRWATNAS